MKLEIDEKVFNSFAFFAGIVALKMFAMSLLTAVNRFKNGTFANQEDIMDKKKQSVKFDDQDVERVRRAHMNDVENILPFFIIGLLYCFTHPAYGTANLIFKSFTIARFVHTLVYAVVVVRQPSRALAWAVSYAINIYMAVNVVMYFMSG